MNYGTIPAMPLLDEADAAGRLRELLDQDPINDALLERQIARLQERFAVLCATSPFGLWGPGLVVTGEMRSHTESLLPLVEIRRSFERLCHLSFREPPFLEASLFHRAATWLDVLEQLDPPLSSANPARLLRHLTDDGAYRTRFLCAQSMPRRYGGAFDRYPGQTAGLARWLREAGLRRQQVRCLDAACGCGEGTYALARTLLDLGVASRDFSVRGTSADPLELYAGAYGIFPHDRLRQKAFRAALEPLRVAGALARISFAREDLQQPCDSGRYDIILCNGILGGPFLHERRGLAQAISDLAGRLAPGGIVLAADRFHDGWKKIVPPALLEALLVNAGLSVVPVEDGVAGIRTG